MNRKCVLIVLVLLLIGCASGDAVKQPLSLAPTRDAERACAQYEVDLEQAMLDMTLALDLGEAQILSAFDAIYAELGKGRCGPRVDAAFQAWFDLMRSILVMMEKEDFAALGNLFITFESDLERIAEELGAAMDEAQD